MTTEQISPAGQVTPEQPWGTAPAVVATPPTPAPRRRWSVVTMVVVAAVAIALAIGGGIAVSNLTGSSTTNAAGGPGGMGGAGGAGGPGGGGGLGNALHGDYVVSDGNGGYAARRLQTGEVTAVSSSSISLKSADGFTGTFAIASSTTVASTLGDIQTGTTVTVVATVSGDTATAVSIGTSGGQGGPGGAQGGQGGAPGQGTTN